MGSITHWDAKIHESVFRDLSVTILDKSHGVRTLWALFYDNSLLGNIILKGIYVEKKKVTNGAGIPTHSHALANRKIVDADLLWDNVTKILQEMIITKSGILAVV